jgi:hypothetical protein
MDEPRFVPVDLTQLMDDGVLMAANEAFFWPLGLALTWEVPDGARQREADGLPVGPASNLHVREWKYENGHHESIGLAPDDEVGKAKRALFRTWLYDRIASLPADERTRAEIVGRVGGSK